MQCVHGEGAQNVRRGEAGMKGSRTGFAGENVSARGWSGINRLPDHATCQRYARHMQDMVGSVPVACVLCQR